MRKYTFPSAKMMEETFGHSTGLSAKDFRVRMASMKSDVETYVKNYRSTRVEGHWEFFPKTEGWVRSCFHGPIVVEVLMKMFDELTGGYGVESIPGSETKNRSRLDYVNHGDTYSDTILRFSGSTRFYIGCWGDCVK